MDDADEPIEAIGFLARSANRWWILRTLRDTGPMSERELREKGDATRTTLQRNLVTLEEQDWINQPTQRTYALTLAGEAIVEQFETFTQTVEVTERLASLLEWIPQDSFDLDLHHLADATISVSTNADPYAPVNDHMRAMKEGETFRCMVPAIGLPAMTVSRDCVERGCEHTIVVDPDAAETLRTDENYADVVADLTESDCCTLLEAADPVPYYLGIADDVVQIGVGDDEGKPQALVESRSDAVRSWAEETLDTYVDGARPLFGERKSTD